MMNNVIRTGKATSDGQELVISHYRKGVWKVLALKADGTCVWFTPTTSKAQALRWVEQHGVQTVNS